MFCYKCVEKVRNKSGKIVLYKLKNPKGDIIGFKPDDLYRAMCNQEFRCANLKISRGNRHIIDEKNILDFDVDIYQACMLRARFMQGVAITPDLIYDMYMSSVGRQRFNNLQRYFVYREIWNCLCPDAVYPYMRCGNDGMDIVLCVSFIINGTFVIQDFVTKIYDRCFTNRISYSHFPEAISLKVINRSPCTDMTQLFCDSGKLKKLDLSEFDTSRVTCMREMFKFCPSLENLDMSSMNFSHVEDMRGMFYNCKSLESVDFAGCDLSSVKFMHSAFTSCSSLKSVNLSHCNAVSLVNIGCLFSNCESLKWVDVSGITSKELREMSGMFSLCVKIEYLDLRSLNTSNVLMMHNLFDSCLALKDIQHNFDMSKVTDISRMFYNCRSLESVDTFNFKTEDYCYIRDMFYNCIALSEIDISGIKVVFDEFNARGFCFGCAKLKKLKICNYTVDTSKTEYQAGGDWFAETIEYCGLPNLELYGHRTILEYIKSNCSCFTGKTQLKFVYDSNEEPWVPGETHNIGMRDIVVKVVKLVPFNKNK